MTARRKTGEAESIKDRRAKAMELRLAGNSYRAIGREMKVSQQSAYRWVQDACAELDTVTRQRAERLRDLELQRCDKLTLALWPKAKNGNDKAAAVILRVMERRSHLLGLDAADQWKRESDLRDSLSREQAFQFVRAISVGVKEALERYVADTDLRGAILGSIRSRFAELVAGRGFAGFDADGGTSTVALARPVHSSAADTGRVEGLTVEAAGDPDS